MIVIYSDIHRKHSPKQEFLVGQFIAYREVPTRATNIIDHCKLLGFEIIDPIDFGIDPILSVHTLEYYEYIKNGYKDWISDGGNPNGVFPDTFAVRLNTKFQKKCQSCIGRPGYYTFDGTAVLVDGTFEAAYQACQVALTGAKLLENHFSAFSLCRPPGHHASNDLAGGYCFFNNAAIAAEYLSKQGKVAILDIDYHHGNGTQEIFYDRMNPLYVSLHSDPAIDYPYYWGFEEEKGSGLGLGFNLNIPLPKSTTNNEYLTKLDIAVNRIKEYDPNFLVVSLGVDTFKDDPVGGFQLDENCYTEISKKIRSINVKTLFVMEGGYNIDLIGSNVCNVLSAYLK